ncbi:MAG: dephospho-CoA kinase, partial [Rhodospirillaceae bacterium]|nr:dephospho-CoA kinase [Rhodospirillaceae bacterium]
MVWTRPRGNPPTARLRFKRHRSTGGPMSRPFVLGLTGAIGMGKTQTAAGFLMFGVPVFDADKAVHMLLSPGGKASKDVAVMFPLAVVDGVIDRKKLGHIVFKSIEKLHSLEAIL